MKQKDKDLISVNENSVETVPDKHPAKSSRRLDINLCMIVLVIAFVGIGAFLLWNSLSRGVNAATNAYSPAVSEAEENAYQSFYEKGYESAEKAHHVSNRVSISIGELQEKQSLEVLRVSDVDYEIVDEETKGIEDLFNNRTEGMTIWMEIPGNGVFTVNLQAGEFIIDDERQYVLVRVPAPELTEFTIDYGNVQMLYFKDSKFIQDPVENGVDKAKEFLQNAQINLIQAAKNDQDYYKRACSSAENMLVNMVKDLNPQLTELEVEVEFTE